MSWLVKPPDCTCEYPRLIARNMCGHTPPCPVYLRWKAERDAEYMRVRAEKAAEQCRLDAIGGEP